MKAVKPKNNETHEDFVVRAHEKLMNSVPDADERNELVWSTWRNSRGLTDAEAACEKEFGGSDKFHVRPNVCYFVEHETVDGQGNDVTFGHSDLAEITQTNNKRISELKAFSAISDNHTHPDDHSHEGDPPVLGAVGCYKLGMVGDKEPKFAIFGDEYQYKSAADDLARKPRRSVELITFHTTGERYIDPVAALGGRAPRLAMPTQYSVEAYSSSGRPDVVRYRCETEKYTATCSNCNCDLSDCKEGDSCPKCGETDKYEVDSRIPSPPPPPGSGKKRKQSWAGKIKPPPPPPKLSEGKKRDRAVGKIAEPPFHEKLGKYRKVASSEYGDSKDKKRYSSDQDVIPSDNAMEGITQSSGERFSAAAAGAAGSAGMAGGASGGAYPSGSNTRPKSTDYFASDQPAEDNENLEQDNFEMQDVNDETIAKLVNAIGNMPEFTWVREQMDAETGGAIEAEPAGVGAEADLDAGLMDGDAVDGMDQLSGESEMDQNAMFGEASGGGIVTPPSEDVEFDDQADSDQYGAGMAPMSTSQYEEEPQMYSNSRRKGVSVSRYSALETKHNALLRSHKKMQKTLGNVAQQMRQNEQEKIDMERSQKIDQVCSRYSAILDPQAEKSRLLGESVSHDKFAQELEHLEGIGHRLEQTSVTRNSIPSGHQTSTYRGNADHSVERNAAWFAKCNEIQLNAANSNKFHDWAELESLTDEAMAK